MTAPAAAELLRVDGLAVSYGNVRALEGISLTVEAGQIVTVIGPNGAGKSTLLNGLIGLVAEDEGDIRFDGRSIVDIPVEGRVGEGMCLVPETRELFAAMTVEDNLMLGGFARYVRGDRALREELGRVYDLFPRLRERSVQYAGTLSGGERQMLALGRALMAKPRLLMLDEPSLGLAPIIVREIFGIIRSLREMGVAILLVEQNARAALQVASYGYVLETGELTLEGPADELENNPRVAATYLGLAR